MLSVLFLSLFSFASQDSVAVFMRPEKVVVLINDYDSQSALAKGLNGKDLFWESENFFANCAQAREGVTCTFRILPPANSRLDAKEVTWEGDAPFADFAAQYESSRGNYLILASSQGRLSLRAGRK